MLPSFYLAATSLILSKDPSLPLKSRRKARRKAEHMIRQHIAAGERKQACWQAVNRQVANIERDQGKRSTTPLVI